VVGVELEEAAAHPYSDSRGGWIEPGAILFLRDRGAALAGALAIEPLPKLPVPR
jgi:hypothetical protein